VALSSMNSRVGVVNSTDLKSDSSFAHRTVIALMSFLQAQLRDWGVALLKLISHRQGRSFWELTRQQLKGITTIFTQTYEGRSGHDINVLPWKGHLSLLGCIGHLIDSPSKNDFLTMVKVGKANTWPKVPRILIHCRIETALEECVQKLRFQLAKENMELSEQLIEDESPKLGRSGSGNKLTRKQSQREWSDKAETALNMNDDEEEEEDEPMFLDDDIENDIENDDNDENQNRGATTVLAQLSGFSVMDRTVQPPTLNGGGGAPSRLQRRNSISSSNEAGYREMIDHNNITNTKNKKDKIDQEIVHNTSKSSQKRRHSIMTPNQFKYINMNEDNEEGENMNDVAQIEDFSMPTRSGSGRDLMGSTAQGGGGGGKMVKSTSMSSFYYKKSLSSANLSSLNLSDSDSDIPTD